MRSLKSFRPLIQNFILLATALSIAACGSETSTPRPPQQYHIAAGNNQNSSSLQPKLFIPRPWETWGSGRDLVGERVGARSILLGDEFFKIGQRSKALEEYLKEAPEKLAENEREALVLRRSAVNLSIDRPDAALSLLSDYFRAQQKTVAQVGAPFSLVFAFAYGRKGDIQQSLAWFSRAASVADPKLGLSAAAEVGTLSLLSSLPPDRFEAIALAWHDDNFVRSACAQERFKREQQGSARVAANQGSVFFAEYYNDLPKDSGVSTTAANVVSVASGALPLGVLLPLSGQYANLGTNIKNGIELAVEGQQVKAAPVEATSATPVPAPDELNSINLLVRDTAGDASQAVIGARELSGSNNASLILGPLLAEPSKMVAEVARQQGFSLISFSKRADFQTGNGVYRLGPTVDSQIQSLLDMALKARGLKRFAGVFSDDASGHEFAQVFREQLGKRKLELLFETFYRKDDSNAFLAIGQEMDSSAVQAIFVPESVATATRFFSSLSPQLRKRVTPLGSANWDNPIELSQSGILLDGALYVSPFFSSSPRALISDFITSYKAKYNAAPDFLAAQGFDAATIAITALRRASEQRVNLEVALSELEPYQGLTGWISLNAGGELNRKFAVITLAAGSLSEVEEPVAAPTEPSTPSFIMRGNDVVSAPKP